MNDDEIKCLAWDLIGEYAHLVGKTHLIYVGEGGRVGYSFARRSGDASILLKRVSKHANPQEVGRYIGVDEVVRLRVKR